MPELTELTNGLRIITDHVPTVGSIAVGAWFDVGARDEEAQENGIAHLVEHMMFKGTPTRTAREIAEQIEMLGGQANAYTSREATAYFIHILDKHAPQAIDLLSDLLQNSLFDPEELERERDVILQEINMVQDTPDDLVFDCYQEYAFSGQSAGAPILGRPEIISSMSREDVQNYVKRKYTPSNMVISAAGNLDHQEIVKMVSDKFDHLPANQNHSRPEARYTGGEYRKEKKLEQSHIIIGMKGVAKTDPAYYTMNLLTTILGGGMSSRLFQEIREKRGLVYSIYSFHLGLSDTGLFGVYAGTSPDKLDELMPVVSDEILNMAAQIEDSELQRAKNQLKSELILDREKMLTRANQQARHLLMHDKIVDPEEITGKIEAVNVEDILSLATALLQSPPTLAALGPLGQLKDYDAIRSALAA